MSTTTTARPNTYAGTCAHCGKHVPAATGLLGAKINGRWTVTHTNCTTPGAKPASGKPATKPATGDRATYAQIAMIQRLINSGAWHDSDAGQGHNAPTGTQLAAMSRREASYLIEDLKGY